VIEVEVAAIMESGESVLKPGDTLVRRGTVYAWAHRTNNAAAFAALLVGASDVPRV
jgi:hypothetical protein